MSLANVRDDCNESRSNKSKNQSMNNGARPVSSVIIDAPNNVSLIYFMENPEGSLIRIGFTGRNDSNKRLEEHRKYGYREIALVPGHMQDEMKIHNHFSFCNVPLSGDTSHFKAEEVRPYVAELLEQHFAEKDVQKAIQLSRVPFSQWSPKSLIGRPIMQHDQVCLFHVEGARAEQRDTWQTPPYIADLCRDVFGGCIDLDPASCAEANSRIKAIYFYNEKSNGLRMPWHGKVFLNPPYESAGGAEKFIEKLIHELSCGNVKEAITVLNLQSVPTRWFPRVREYSSAHAIFGKRIQFYGPLSKSGNSTAFGASKNGTIFSYFGKDPSRFLEVFSPHAMAFSESNIAKMVSSDDAPELASERLS